ncbi:superoxide dismutase family protein [Rhodococcus oxybenzonivorans]|jgi:Cu-Zn family superoxide dismutase|uniref:superoxide dismutase[Cu-Zn] n=1 Tax=Rhodococcus TaxID=1827 RepID=UPI00135C81DC|nr:MULTISPECIES: superoxide dismutase family protein [Rhodococcus]MDV7357326.1 superoxide dismutase family protein [Rhodococcus oxybenzonivorans]
MASSTTRRMSWRIVTPVVAIAALGLTACSNNEEPSDVSGTTPPVWTGAADPSAADVPGDAGHGSAGGHSESGSGSETLTATFKNAEGNDVGTATFTQSGEHVEVTVSVKDQTPGFHGFHVHSVGKCETNSVAPTGGAPGNFLSAGGHFQVEGHSGHPSSGDLTSLQILEDGTGELVTTTDAFTVEDLKNSEAGTAVMIHSGADNFANIPTRYAPAPDQETLSTGDAGSRVACGVLGES